MAFAEIVVNDWFVPMLYQLFDNDAADVTGSAGDQNLHVCLVYFEAPLGGA
jgi:hypothetical protein